MRPFTARFRSVAIDNEAMTPTCYEKDFAQWAFDTARAIRERRFDVIDWENVAEELETLGRSERRELRSHLAQLIYHLLKLQHQPERRTLSWTRTVNNQRKQIYDVLDEEPSLRAYLRDPEALSRSYLGVRSLAIEDGLPEEVMDRFPDQCPYAIEMLLPDLDR
jgi:uncharacterized protein DUF29